MIEAEQLLAMSVRMTRKRYSHGEDIEKRYPGCTLEHFRLSDAEKIRAELDHLRAVIADNSLWIRSILIVHELPTPIKQGATNRIALNDAAVGGEE